MEFIATQKQEDLIKLIAWKSRSFGCTWSKCIIQSLNQYKTEIETKG